MITARNTASSLLLLTALAGCASSQTEAKEPSSSGTKPAPAATAEAPAVVEPTAELAQAEEAIKAGDGAGASKAAEAALSKAPKNAKAHFFAGLGADMQDDKAGAEQHFREALAADKNMVDAAINLGSLLVTSKREGEAVKLLKPYATHANGADDVLLQSVYAAALSGTGDHAGASAIYAKLVAKGNSSPEIRLGYAGELIEAGKKDEAVKTLSEGAAASNDRDAIAAFGRALAKAGAYEEAIKALDKAIGLKTSADLLTYRALFKRSLKNLPGAKADLEEASKVDPSFPQAYLYLGEVLEELKKPADAKKAYQKAAEVGGDNPTGKRAQERLATLGKKK